MFIQYYMTRKPTTIGPDMLVSSAIELLNKKDFRHLPVVDEKGTMLAMVTDRDLRSAGPSTMLSGEEQERVLILFTRLIRTEGQGVEPAMLYVRMNTMNIRSVHRIVEEAGFTVHIPTLDLD